MKNMKNKTDNLNLYTLPGHHARRVHQAAVALFAEEVGELKLTPVQYAALQTICNTPGIDQTTLAKAIAFDTSTINGVIDRLEARGLLERNASATDKRVRLITPTAQGKEVLKEAIPCVLRSQTRLLAPLTEKERKEYLRLTQLIISAETGPDKGSR